MKLLRIDHLAPEGAPLQLHPQLTVLRGATPEIRRKLIQLFQAFSTPGQLECSGVIEVGAVQLALDQLTLQGLHLDPSVNAVLQWETAVLASPAVSQAQLEPSATQQGVVAQRQELQQVVQARTQLMMQMEQARSDLDAMAASVLNTCRGQIDTLESRRAVLKADWKRDRQHLDSYREELQNQIAVLIDKLDMVSRLDLLEVCDTLAELKSLLTVTMAPDPVAQDLAVRIYSSLRNLREISDLTVAATSRRIEVEQNLDAAQDDLSSSTAASVSPAPDPSDLIRLEELRNHIFSYPSLLLPLSELSSQTAQPVQTLQDLRLEETLLLQRLGYESYSAYVRGIPLVQSDVERASRRDSALLRVQQYEQELQQLLIGSPDPQDLELAEMELSVMLQTASALLGRVDPLGTDGSVDLDSEFSVGQVSAAAADAQRAESVREVVAELRERKVEVVVADSEQVFATADLLRLAVQRAAGPVLTQTWIDSDAWTSSPERLVEGVDLWLAVFQDPSDWVATTQSQVYDLRAQIAATETEELEQRDVSEWAQVEAELDNLMDTMIDAQSRVAQHDEAMLQVADLREEELQLRAQERDLLESLAHGEANLHKAERPEPVLPPTYRSSPRVHRKPSAANDCEWALIERVAQQRTVSFLGSVPLLIDSLPSDPLAQHKVIERAREMSAVVQLVILSENQWLFEQAQTGRFLASAIQF